MDYSQTNIMFLGDCCNIIEERHERRIEQLETRLEM